MKKFVLSILLFLAIVAVIDFAVGYVGDYLQAHPKGGDTKRTNDLVMYDQHDIVVFGSSRASHHYDAPYMSEVLGLDVYNAGYDGNGVVLSFGLLSMMLERYQPKLVIFDVEPAFDISVYPPDNGHKRYISRLKPYFRHTAVGAVIKDVSTEEYYKTHSGMIRYNTSIFDKLKDYLRRGVLRESGFSPMTGVYTGEPKKNTESPECDAFKLDYVEKLLLLAHSKDVPIIVVASPKYGRESSSDVIPVRTICTKLEVPFFDYYADSTFMQHKEWFKEPMHLNSVGARVFSQIITDKICNCLPF